MTSRKNIHKAIRHYLITVHLCVDSVHSAGLTVELMEAKCAIEQRHHPLMNYVYVIDEPVNLNPPPCELLIPLDQSSDESTQEQRAAEPSRKTTQG